MSINRITPYLTNLPREDRMVASEMPGAKPVPTEVVEEVATTVEMARTTDILRGMAEESSQPVEIKQDMVEITPEATQAAKEWNAHVRSMQGGGLEASFKVDAAVNTLLVDL